MTEDAFRFSNSILNTKEYLTDLTEYNPFFTNKALSQHVDCLLHVNVMNITHESTSSKMQYDYYFHAIKKMKRKYGKWGSKTKDDDIQLLMQYFDYSRDKAESVISILTKEQIKEIKEKIK